MTKNQFEKKLRAFNHEELISLLLSFYESNAEFQTLMSALITTGTSANPEIAVNTLTSADKEKAAKAVTKNMEKYLDKLEKVFDVEPPRSPSLVKAEKILNEFISSKPAPTGADVALFRLHYAEFCVDELDFYGGGPEELEDVAGENYRAALDYAQKHESFFFDHLVLLNDVAVTFPGTEYLFEWLQDLIYRGDLARLLDRIDAVIKYYGGTGKGADKRYGEDENGEIYDRMENRVRGLLYIAHLLYPFSTPESPRSSDKSRYTKNLIKQIIAKLKAIPAKMATKEFPEQLIKTLAHVYAIDEKKISPTQQPQ